MAWTALQAGTKYIENEAQLKMDFAWGVSPVNSYSGVKAMIEKEEENNRCARCA